MKPVPFLRRITSLIPPAGQNLVRYFGVLGPAAKNRCKVVPLPIIVLPHTPNGARPEPAHSRYIDWATLLRRVYDVDALACPCGGRVRIIAFIEEPPVVCRILKHVGLSSETYSLRSARGPPEFESFSSDA